jgi:23S rRNA pseudouridine955/2504/2580 synthase
MHRTAEQEANLVEQGMAFMVRRDTPCKLYPVNRLDRGTSGAVILAKSSTSAGIYGRHVKETGLEKLYLALVERVPDGVGVIDAPLDNKPSETRYNILLRGERCALLAVVPVSGRMHQIRRHLALIGHPVKGDKRYGGGETALHPGFALHSFRTVVARPEAGTLTVCAPLPEEMLDLCSSCGIGREEVLTAVKGLAVGPTCGGLQSPDIIERGGADS